MASQCGSAEQVQAVIQRALQLHHRVNELLRRAEQWSRDYQRALARVDVMPSDSSDPQQKSACHPVAQRRTYQTPRKGVTLQLESGKSGTIPLSSYPSFRDSEREESPPASITRGPDA